MCGVSVGIFHSFPKMLMVTIKFLMLPILFACILHEMRVFDHTHTHKPRTCSHIQFQYHFDTVSQITKELNKQVVFHSEHLILSSLSHTHTHDVYSFTYDSNVA